MTDTPRTEEELLTIFEDGQVGTIAAQDMRDFVVSVTGLPRLTAKESGAGTLYHSDAFYHPAQSDVIQDDLGMVYPSTYTSAWYSGEEWAAGQSFLLTPGRYEFAASMEADEGFGSLTDAELRTLDFGIDFIENPTAFSPLDPWHGNGLFDWVRSTPYEASIFVRGSLILPAGNVPRHVGPVVLQYTGTDLTLSFHYDIKKVAWL